MHITITGREITTIIFFLGALIIRALGYNSIMEYILIAIVSAHVGITFIPRFRRPK